ncbi:GT2 family glycosyltransferase [Pseudomonas duriflava]|uniref:GT2 family glycosyltransferase n=1 Tax=Pseudomonas duriflava TaxID=459528 RepID=A0A562PXY9_9PSED|nr:glycosyltransferase [Pseudomonas duriflava]TWI49287.1 GT2 family glycosyltransferase [Pseudomonas duriflava]
MGLLKLMDEYYAFQRSGQQSMAKQRLAMAMQVSELRPDALVALGLAAVEQQRFQHAFIHLAEAYGSLAKRSDIAALLAHVLLLKKQPEYACAFLSDSANPARNEPAVRLMRLRALAAMPDVSVKQLKEQLPYVQSAEELAFVLSKLPRRVWGFVEFDPLSQELQGWAIDTAKPSRPITLTLHTGQKKMKWQAMLACPLLAKSGNGGRLGGIRIKLPEHARLSVTFDEGIELLGSPIAALTPLPVHTLSGEVSATATAREAPVDVLIPVYKGKDATLACIHSALESREYNRTPFTLVVLDDVSPEPELSQALDNLAAQGLIELHRHPANLGFIRNMNRGMLLHPERDVLWLNSDARVCGDWLDRLRQAAYSAPDIATATPFSNNGELMSFPQSRISHRMPDLAEQQLLDFLTANGPDEVLELEVGCGFCFYIKRVALNAVGLLDELYLKRGYGEETDWCLRAKEQGWRHVGAHRVFVAHRGGVSFGAEKIPRVAFNNAVLRQRYPAAERAFDRFYRVDSIKPHRDRLQRARLNVFKQAINALKQTGDSLTAWPVIQAFGEAELLARYGQERPALEISYAHQGQSSHVTLAIRLQDFLPLELDYVLPDDTIKLIVDIQQLEVPGLIFRQLGPCPEALLTLPHYLGLEYRLHCADDVLPQPASTGTFDWPAFFQGVKAIQLPYKGLAAEYSRRFPDHDINSHSVIRAPNVSSLPINGTIILVADNLQEPSVRSAWLKLARQLRREDDQYLLLINQDAPWSRELLACGNVAVLPELPGLNRAEMLRAASCQLALSLNAQPGCGWLAPQLASLSQLPLFAPKSLIAEEVGAYSSQRLGGALGRLLSELSF